MDIINLHEQFKDKDSPTVEGQIRWLQKQGFLQNQIDQALIRVYSDIERGDLPVVFETTVTKGGKEVPIKRYAFFDTPNLGKEWTRRPINCGWDLDQVIKVAAQSARTKDLQAVIGNIEKFEADMRKKWEREQNKKRGFFKRLFGIK